MHWLGHAAARASLKGANTLLIPQGTSNSDAWEIGARALGTTPPDLANRIAQEASDGAEALRRLTAGEECALLITDLEMPELNGDALLRKPRAQTDRPTQTRRPRSRGPATVILTPERINQNIREVLDS